ncbi:hypothetical protein Sjap_011810 [Stephania japonica]|uniref:SAM-dependent methyltransferase RsmB-F/NOP2-type catalytic core domain-containing protein n=1 Tax=Stephania japonica TaxID=461633 RepID=A0AAP0JC77_9MAGN
MVPNLLVLPPGTDLNVIPLSMMDAYFFKASSMVAVALSPEPGWEVLDACSAPGNKTVHLAALMSGKGKIIACELNKDRVKLLEETIRCSGASSILLIRAILLDPSCSGSGTAAERLDHLLPSNRLAQDSDAADNRRAKNLAAFQSKALAHALSFENLEGFFIALFVKKEMRVTNGLPKNRNNQNIEFFDFTKYNLFDKLGIVIGNGRQMVLIPATADGRAWDSMVEALKGNRPQKGKAVIGHRGRIFDAGTLGP